MTRRRVAMLSVLLLAACTSAPTAVGPDRTGGVTLDAFVRRDATSYARYRVAPEGTIAYGGAQDAIDRAFSWRGALEADDLAAFRALAAPIRAAGNVRDADRGAAGTVEIELRAPDGRVTWRVPLEDERIEALLALLERAARRRHDADLEMLPETEHGHGDDGRPR